MKSRLRKIVGLMTGVALIYIFLLISSSPLFAYRYEHRNFCIYSDKPIPESIDFVLDDAIQRLENSELYNSKNQFKLYFCHEAWRFKFFTRNENAGGVVNFLFSPSIFIRENNVESNQLIPPDTWENSLADRPLSYFIAHEAVHSLQRKYDRFLIFTTPVEIIEGYAEYIAKLKTNDLDALVAQFTTNSPTMNPQNGLYDKYNLYVTYLIEKKGYDFETLIRDKPDMEKVLSQIKLK